MKERDETSDPRSGRPGNRQDAHSRRHHPITVAILFLIPALSACGRATMQHLDGHPFIPSTSIATFDGGWIAVDSCSFGYHALVEFEVEAREPDLAPPSLERLGLWLEPGLRSRPRDVRVEGPVCRPLTGQGMWQKPPYQPGDFQRRCTYLVRAQFTLAWRPMSGDSILIRYAGRTHWVRWP